METLSVSELTQHIKSELESLFPYVRLKGEVSNCKKHSSGHIYLTLKDEAAQIAAIIWKTTASQLTIAPKDGMEVIVEGRLEIYPPVGRYQLICRTVIEAGQGALQQAFAELVHLLANKGYFNPEHKKSLPALPEVIGVITSPTGAVIEDISNVLNRRFAAARVLLYPVKVQGSSAAEEVARGISFFNKTRKKQFRPDIIIIARGGGSLEDLQPFNTEVVATAMYNSIIPTISAVGHETDITIADMVADLRAGTPSMAAELAVPETTQLLNAIEALCRQQQQLVQAKLDGNEQQLYSLCNSYAFNRPLRDMQQSMERLDTLSSIMTKSLTTLYNKELQRYNATTRQLHLLDYRNTLKRGFVLVKKEGKYITNASAVEPAEHIELTFHDGEKQAIIVDEPIE